MKEFLMSHFLKTTACLATLLNLSTCSFAADSDQDTETQEAYNSDYESSVPYSPAAYREEAVDGDVVLTHQAHTNHVFTSIGALLDYDAQKLYDMLVLFESEEELHIDFNFSKMENLTLHGNELLRNGWDNIWKKFSQLTHLTKLFIVGYESNTPFRSIHTFPPHLESLIFYEYDSYYTDFLHKVFKIASLRDLSIIKSNFKLDVFNSLYLSAREIPAKITHLDLSQNALVESSPLLPNVCLSIYIREYFPSLVSLNLSHNKNLDFTNATFTEGNNLKHLDISHTSTDEFPQICVNYELDDKNNYKARFFLESLDLTGTNIKGLIHKNPFSGDLIPIISDTLISLKVDMMHPNFDYRTLFVFKNIQEIEMSADIFKGTMIAWMLNLPLKSIAVRGTGSISLDHIPEIITHFQNIEKLDFSDNRIATITRDVTNLQQLKSLNLGNNQISTLPQSINKLTQLEYLNLKGNRLTEGTEFLKMLQNLHKIDLSDNLLPHIPKCLIDMRMLKEFHYYGPKMFPYGVTDEYLGYEELNHHYKTLRWKELRTIRKIISHEMLGVLQEKQNEHFNLAKFFSIKQSRLDFPIIHNGYPIVELMNNLLDEVNVDNPNNENTFISCEDLVGEENMENKFGRYISRDDAPQDQREWINETLKPYLTDILANLYDIEYSTSESSVVWAHIPNLETTKIFRSTVAYIIHTITKMPQENRIAALTQFINGILNCHTGQTEAYNTLLLNFSGLYLKEFTEFVASINNVYKRVLAEKSVRIASLRRDSSGASPQRLSVHSYAASPFTASSFSREISSQSARESNTASTQFTDAEIERLKRVNFVTYYPNAQPTEAVSVEYGHVEDFLTLLEHSLAKIKDQRLSHAILPFCNDYDEHNTHTVNHYRKELSDTHGFYFHDQSYWDAYQFLDRDPFLRNNNAVLLYYLQINTPQKIINELYNFVQTKEDVELFKKKAETNKRREPEEYARLEAACKEALILRPLTTTKALKLLSDADYFNTHPMKKALEVVKHTGLSKLLNPHLQKILCKNLKIADPWEEFFDSDPYDFNTTPVLTKEGLKRLLIYTNILILKNEDFKPRG